MRDPIDELLDDINDAALAPELWQEIVWRIQELCPESTVEIMLYDAIQHDTPWLYNTIEGKAKKEYIERYRHINSLLPIMKKLECGKVSDTDYFDAINQVKDSEFYNDFMRANDWEYVKGMNIASNPGFIGACVLGYRGTINRKTPELADNLLEQLVSPIQRSFNLSQKYIDRHYGLGSVQEQVDRFKDPAFIIHEDGSIDYMNSAALKALSAGRGVEAKGCGNKLALSHKPSHAGYSALLKQAFKKGNSGLEGLLALKGEIPFFAEGEEGMNSLSVIPISPKRSEVSALVKIYAPDLTRKAIVVLQYYKDNMVRLKPLFKDSFGLTPKEAEFALATMEGYSHEEYEISFGGKVLTTKKHLGRIYEKTGVNEKGKLVSLLHHYKRSFDLKDNFK